MIQTPTHILARVALWPLSIPYAWAVAARNAAYDRGWARIERVRVPVLSLGNLTLGGTGKTPLAAMLLETLETMGIRAGVVSRGYGRRVGGPLSVVSAGDGRGPLVSVEEAGDEPFLLAQLRPHSPVVVGADRVAAARAAVDRCGAQAVVADDAFQHRRLGRDIDLLVVDATNPDAAGWLLPAGALREPMLAVRRATAILFSRCDRIGETTDLQARFRRLHGGLPFFHTVAHPRDLVLPDGETVAPEWLADREVVAFCGIARPGFFREDLQRAGARVRAFLPFPDHHWFGAADLGAIEARLRACGAALLVTTEKDFVRIPESQRASLPLARLRLAVEVWEDRAFRRFLEQRLARVAAA